MKLEGPVEVLFDTSVIIGYCLECFRKEGGDTSRNAFGALIERPRHILRISEDILKECEYNLAKRGYKPNLILPILWGPLEPKGKIKKCQYRPEDIELKVSIPEHDRHLAEAAVAVKTRSLEKNALPKKKRKRKGITVCLVTKNLRHFEPEELRRNHDISVLTPEEYADP